MAATVSGITWGSRGKLEPVVGSLLGWFAKDSYVGNGGLPVIHLAMAGVALSVSVVFLGRERRECDARITALTTAHSAELQAMRRDAQLLQSVIRDLNLRRPRRCSI